MWAVPDGALAPREVSQITQVQVSTGPGKTTILDPSDTLCDPVVERTLMLLVETSGGLVVNRSGPGSAPYGTVDDSGRVKLSSEVAIKTGAARMTRTVKASNRKISKRL